jgi:ribosomal protein L32
MIALLDWPALEKCSSCGKLRIVSHENCQHCGVAFSAPPHDGTEIYDNATPRVEHLAGAV